MHTTTPSPDQRLAISTITEGDDKYLSLTASPGCGKSYVVKAIRDSGYPIILSSTTGVSAINIGGVTVNSLLGHFDSEDMRRKHDAGHIYDALRKYAASGVLVVIDEVSMFSSTQFQILVVNNERLQASEGKAVRFLFVGDFGQLPPVKESPVFDSPLWVPKYIRHLTLTEVHRTSDTAFIDALRCLRVGDSKAALPYFEALGFYDGIDMDFRGTTLYALNDSANRHNQHSLTRLDGESMYYHPVKEGDPLPEWKNIPDPLELKLGALVILRSNQWEDGYVNGDQGYVLDMTPEYVDVKLLRGPMVRVRAISNKYKTSTKRGRITYIPMMLAYALTTHKAQSLSIDYLQVVLDDPVAGGNLRFMARTHGMAFMAISRATTPQHLRIVGDSHAFLEACYCDRKYLPHIT
jgi:ATP-dependent exoDNAse (exonuclease V) alpha subunit